MYRPQFDYCPPPDGFTDEEFIYSFDASNTPALGICVAPGQTRENIPLQTQLDADFYWRATKAGVRAGFGAALQFKDAFGNFLSDSYVPSWAYGDRPEIGPPGCVSTVREPETRLVKGATLLLNVANLAATYTPSQVSGAVGLGVPTQQNSTFPYNGRIYMFVSTAGNGISAKVSTDGVTFQLSDPANDVPATNAGPATYWDRVGNTVYLCYQVGVGGPLTLRSFNLQTGRWNAVINAAGPTDFTPQFLWLRPNGTFLVLGTSSAFVGGYAGVQYSAGVWGAEFDAATNIEALPGFGTSTFTGQWSVMDPATGTVHIILNATGGAVGPPSWQNRFFYQQVSQTNVLGVFQEFNAAQQQNALGAQFLSQLVTIPGNLEIAQGSLVWGIATDQPIFGGGTKPLPAVYVGAPLTNPVWNASGNIGPARVSPSIYPIANGFPSIRYDSLTNTLYAMWAQFQPTSLGIQIAFNTSGNWLTGNWQTYTALPNLGAPYGAVDGPRITLQYGANGPYVGFTFNGKSDTVEYFAGQAITGMKIMLRGVKRIPNAALAICSA